MANIEEKTTSVREGYSLDVQSLGDYLTTQQGFDLPDPLTVRQFSVGQSNPTYLLSSGTKKWVLRKKPPGDLLPSAHQVEREHRVMKALHGSAVPVPTMHFLETDPHVLGTAFYVMDFVSGRSLRDPRLQGVDAAQRKDIHFALIDSLAALHSIEPSAIGLDDFGRHSGYIERQISRWTKQYKAAQTDTIVEMDRLMTWLPDHMPNGAQGDAAPSCIVHGDFRLDNCILDADQPTVAAVLDWELSTIGHPYSDLAYTLMAFDTPDTNGVFPALKGVDLSAHSLPNIDELLQRYCDQRGLDTIADFSFYQAFSFFRMSAILQGIAARAQQGNATGRNAEQMGALANHFAKIGWAKATDLG